MHRYGGLASHSLLHLHPSSRGGGHLKVQHGSGAPAVRSQHTGPGPLGVLEPAATAPSSPAGCVFFTCSISLACRPAHSGPGGLSGPPEAYEDVQHPGATPQGLRGCLPPITATLRQLTVSGEEAFGAGMRDRHAHKTPEGRGDCAWATCCLPGAGSACVAAFPDVSERCWGPPVLLVQKLRP